MNIRPKKSLGQNFLKNPRILQAIAEVAEISRQDAVLEIGPGGGALTERLSRTARRVVAVEKDRRLISELEKKFSGSNVKIVEGDILKIDPLQLGLDAGAYTIAANIPYYLTSRLLRLMLSSWPRPQRAVLMVQKEIAERIIAKPPDMNLLGLAVQLYADARIALRVGRGNFSPMPDVNSAVVVIVPKQNEMSDTEREEVLRLAGAAFRGKRKMLANTLSQAMGITKSATGELLVSLGLNPKIRPEGVSRESWIVISKKLVVRSPGSAA